MKYVRAFIAGIIVPSVLLPFVLLIAVLNGRGAVLTVPILHFIPMFWGIWNVLYFAFKDSLPNQLDLRLLLTGAALGLLVAILGVFWVHLPTMMGMDQLEYYPLLAAPIIYAILWRFVVKPFNDLMGLDS